MELGGFTRALSQAIRMAIRLAIPWAIMDPACLQVVLYRPKSPRDLGLYKAPRNTRGSQQLLSQTIRMDHPDGMAGGMAVGHHGSGLCTRGLAQA